MAAATIAAVAATVYPIVESIFRETNSKKANKLRKRLEQVLAQYNVKIDQLRNQLEQKGIRFNQLMDKLGYASPVGSAHEAKRNVTRQYNDDVATINSQINEATKQMNNYSAEMNKQINDIESRGVIRTIFNI